MSADGTIVASHLWKRFRSDRTRPVLRDELERLRGGEGRGWRWVLRDVDFKIEPGEAVGLFGINGSGKSTLLKILTRVMYPHSGNLEVAGRVGALIEIRAGIHPDLTGRENVYLYGSLMGLSRAGIASRFDEIIEFAELADAVDRQVKFYSSGMGMRLGFAVAAFLNPNVLLVDEVLAVGDASFQQKCLSRMREVLAEGTTLVYVSHDLTTVEAICERGLWLQDGAIRCDAPIEEALAAYRQELEHVAAGIDRSACQVQIAAAPVPNGTVTTGSTLPLELSVTAKTPASGRLWVGITSGTAAPILSACLDVDLGVGESVVTCRFDDLPLSKGTYYAWGGMVDSSGVDILPWSPLTEFEVGGTDAPATPPGVLRLAPIVAKSQWSGAPVARTSG